MIDSIVQWADQSSDNSSDHRVLVLIGGAGTGKSSIAHSVAAHFDRLDRLGSSFCFNRSREADLPPEILFSTIARDLADRDPLQKQALCSSVKERSRRYTASLKEQFENFLLDPSKALTNVGPIAIVIDALDECRDGDKKDQLLEIICSRLSELPSQYRIIITARPEIRDLLDASKGITIKDMSEIDPQSTESDLTVYVKHELANVKSKLERHWPNDTWCSELVSKSEGSFLWISTACRYVKTPPPGRAVVRSLRDILSIQVPLGRGQLDSLYKQVLERTFSHAGTGSMERERFERIMATILTIKQPLPIGALMELQDKDADDDERGWWVKSIVRPLGSLLDGTVGDTTPIRFLHSSFCDFLLNKSRSGEYHVDCSQEEKRLAGSTLQIMESMLKFNICDVGSSFIRNEDLKEEDINSALPGQLRYACQFWTDHVTKSACEDLLKNRVQNLICTKLLFWLEVISVLGKTQSAHGMIKQLLSWYQVRQILLWKQRSFKGRRAIQT
jgi:NACHT domain